MIFINRITRINKIDFKKSFHFVEFYDYITPVSCLAGAAKAQGSATNIADKDVYLVLVPHEAAPPLKARDGRGAPALPHCLALPKPLKTFVLRPFGGFPASRPAL